jgi:hypothetical protein
MVHQTMATKISPAPMASSSMSVMGRLQKVCCGLAILGTLAACGSAPRLPPAQPDVPSAPASPSASAAQASATAQTTPNGANPVITQARSRWVAVGWGELPGVEQDALDEAWNAWLKSCERSTALPAPLAAFSQLTLTGPHRAGDTLGYRYDESCLSVGAEISVYAEASDVDGTLVLRKPEAKDALFIVSPRSLQELAQGVKTSAVLLFGSSIGVALLAGVVLMLGVIR